MEYWKNRNINDLDGEIWVDAVGYDGIYSVSNLGRVKSERRYVNNGNGGRWVKEKILSQARCADGRLSVNLSYLNIAKSHQLNQLVYYSFYPEKINDNINDEVYHINKKQDDNRLINLSYNSVHGKSYKISIDLGNVTHLGKARKSLHPYTKNSSIFVDGHITHKICKKCKVLLKIDSFYNFSNTCKDCRNAEKRSRYYKLKGIRNDGKKT